MKIISWNVNGIRAIYKKGLVQFLERERPDVFCFQETKAHPDQVEPALKELLNAQSYWSSAKRKGYSGTATFVLGEKVSSTSYGIGIEEYDSEGRFVITSHKDFDLYNIYFPNGGSGEERHLFKQKFLRDLYNHLQVKVKSGREVIVTGDYNIAHQPVDVYDPVRLANESGFLPEEREWMTRFLQMGFIDTFREKHPNEEERYTWWSYRERARIGNQGWRIDYFCVTKGLWGRVKRADILDSIEGSDHCPLVLELTD